MNFSPDLSGAWESSEKDSSAMPTSGRGRLIVIAGPSGVGKGTLIANVLPRLSSTVLAKSATTRPKRGDEKQGREYYFLRPEEFEQKVKQEEFIEHVQYGSSRYGTLKSEVESHLSAGRNVIVEIEVEGARNIRHQIPDALLIFIEPPSIEELGRRLKGRNTETGEEIDLRLARAREELAAREEFDYIVVNNEIDRASDELERSINMGLHGGAF